MSEALRARRAKWDKWQTVRVHRSQIDLADYNPRTIDKYAGEGLGNSLKKHGVAEKPTLNRRSAAKGFEEKWITTPTGERLWVGTLVGGHQRLAQVDATEKDLDYTLEVVLVDVDLKQEKEMNVVLNNATIQGQYDADKLLALIQEGAENFDISNAGFDTMSLQAMFDLDVVLPGNEKMFSADQQSAAAQELLNGAQELGAKKVDARQAKEAEVAAIKEKKKQAREAAQKKDDANFIANVVFRNSDELQLFKNAMGADTQYVDGVRVLSALGLSVQQEATQEATQEAQQPDQPEADG